MTSALNNIAMQIAERTIITARSPRAELAPDEPPALFAIPDASFLPQIT